VHGSMDLGIDDDGNGGGEGGRRVVSHSLGKVYMPGARIDGDLSLGPGTFQYPKDDPDFWEAYKRVAIDATDCEIKGGLALCAIDSYGAVLIDRTTIGKELSATGGHFINPGSLALSAVNTRVADDVEMYPEFDQALEVDGLIDFTTAQVQGNFV